MEACSHSSWNRISSVEWVPRNASTVAVASSPDRSVHLGCGVVRHLGQVADALDLGRESHQLGTLAQDDDLGAPLARGIFLGEFRDHGCHDRAELPAQFRVGHARIETDVVQHGRRERDVVGDAAFVAEHVGQLHGMIDARGCRNRHGSGNAAPTQPSTLR